MIIEKVDNTNYLQMEDYEKDFLNLYIKEILFYESVYSQEVKAYDVNERYGKIINAYKVNYDGKYPEIPKGLIVRFEKNQKTSNSQEYYVIFSDNENIKIQSNFFSDLTEESVLYIIYSRKVYYNSTTDITMDIADYLTTEYPISPVEVNVNH